MQINSTDCCTAGKVQQVPWTANTDQRLVNDFIQSVKENRTPSITGEDGLRTLEVVKAAYQSSRLQQAVSLSRAEV